MLWIYKRYFAKFLIGALVLFSILISGCVNVNARLEFQEKPEKTFEKMPFKFYVTSLSLNNLLLNNPDKFRDLLVYYWPELFTKAPDNALRVSWSLNVNSNEDFEADAFLSLLLSFVTYGFLPAIDNYETFAYMTVQIGSISKNFKLNEIGRRTTNAGVMLILSTKSLVPEISGAIYGKSLANSQLTVYSGKEKQFLQFFVEAVCSFPKDEILQYYYSQETNQTQLLR